MRKVLIAAVLAMGLMSSVQGARAQSGQTEVAPALDAMLTQFEGECMGAAKAMPAEKYGFSPADLKIPGAKFDGVRTFAGQVTHLVSANYYFYSQASGLKPDADMKAIGAMKNKDQIVAALAASFAFAHKAIASISTASGLDTIKPVDGQMTRATVAAFAVAHGYDHYGQMVEYLRMNGIVPPSSAK